MEQCESAAALLESVREQEVQFEQLTRALEEERRRVGLPATSPSALGRPLPHAQNGCFGDADIDRLKLADSYINGTQYRMVDPAHGALEESYTPDDDRQEVHSVFSEEGTGRRSDFGMTKPVSRAVMPTDGHLAIDGGLPMSGMGSYSATLDRPYRQPGLDYPTATVPRNYHYGPVGGYDDYRGGPPSEAYTSLSRGSHMDERYRPVDGYRTLDSGYRAPSRQQIDPYAAQPQVMSRGMRALGSALEMRYGLYGLEDDQRSVGYDDYGMGPPPMHPGGYGTMPRLGPGPGGMDRRRLRSCEDTLDGDMGGVDGYSWAVPVTMERGMGSMASLDGTLRKVAPTSWRQPELPEVIAMLNYRLDPVKTNAAAFLQHLTFKNDKVKSEVRRLKGIPSLVSMLDHPNKEVLKLPAELQKGLMEEERTVLRTKTRNCGFNCSFFLKRNLVENCVCLLRNLSYQVHREVPGCERFVETVAINQGPPPANKGGCFGSRKGKGKKDGDDGAADVVEIPKRTTPAKGYELLFQPEVVRVYTSLLKESKNPSVLEAAAGAIQNLCAGRWTYGRYIRATVRQEKGLPMMAELLAHGNDRVVRAMSGALRNLAIDSRNCELLGLHAVPNLVANLPGGHSQSGRALSEETVVSVLSTLAEVLGNNLEAAKTLRASQGIERLVLINKDGCLSSLKRCVNIPASHSKHSDREVRGAGQVLQLVWAHKELRRPLEKDGWKKTDFMVNLSSGTTNGPSTRANGTHEESATPLLEREAYSTLDQRERRHTLDETTDTLPRGVYGGRKGSLPLLDSYDG
ncbi:unnamed protein product [Tetraodon nigroviridis]|uniref:(spotted green pufferfish) hypothetical protein n=1 Tax=Tetraodon nigroviridis TaxID=99883 RepID=Q4S3L5_TETNG|nr:unnamed protein product [Tetraodon nigroviridis]